MNRQILKTILNSMFIILLLSAQAAAHCEIPCGIYDDAMRINMLREHITTIEKSMNQILALEQKPGENANQLIRWVLNKEQHADALQEIVTQYFMTQRIKPEAKQYLVKLQALHELLLAAMKSKQTNDLEQVKRLRELVDQFEKSYFNHTL